LRAVVVSSAILVFVSSEGTCSSIRIYISIFGEYHHQHFRLPPPLCRKVLRVDAARLMNLLLVISAKADSVHSARQVCVSNCKVSSADGINSDCIPARSGSKEIFQVVLARSCRDNIRIVHHVKAK
jgi:hypothetical protein